MTKHQKKIMEALRAGKQISFEVPGWFFDHKKLKAETEDALGETGELARVMIRGKYSVKDFIIHRSHLREFVDDAIMIEFPFGKVRK